MARGGVSMKLYKKRQKALAKQLEPNSLAVIYSGDVKVRSNDTEYPFRVDSNFYYLCGFDKPGAVLVLQKGKKSYKTSLFVEPRDAKKEQWIGKMQGVKEAKSTLGISRVYPLKSLEKKIAKIAKRLPNALYYDFKRDLSSPFRDLASKTKRCYHLPYLIAKMRLVKSKEELELIKKAIAITKEAHIEAMRVYKAQRKEAWLAARMELIFKQRGASHTAYETIVAGGARANILHYTKKDKKLKAGSLVLIDAGCEYGYYASDITRTIPVDGRFSKPQKRIYSLVLDTQKRIIAMCAEGVKLSKLQQEAARLLCSGLVRLGILKGSVKKLLKKGTYKRYYPHGIGHYLGLDVHDALPYVDEQGREIALRAGMVITIEPGIYLPKSDKSIPKRYRGIGVRIEDDILITKKGCINLSAAIPKEIGQIESLYGSRC